MRRGLTLLVVLAVCALPWAAAAQNLRIDPIPPGLIPQWTAVPGVPQVSWAPNLPTDVFRYRGGYYFYWEGYFYRGSAPQGPWKPVAKVPQVFTRVDASYFKTAQAPGATSNSGETLAPSKAKIIEVPPPAPQARPEAPPKVM
jgi:hypothetical protein